MGSINSADGAVDLDPILARRQLVNGRVEDYWDPRIARMYGLICGNRVGEIDLLVGPPAHNIELESCGQIPAFP